MPLNQSNLKHLCNKILQLIDIYNLAHLYTNNDNNPQKNLSQEVLLTLNISCCAGI